MVGMGSGQVVGVGMGRTGVGVGSGGLMALFSAMGPLAMLGLGLRCFHGGGGRAHGRQGIGLDVARHLAKYSHWSLPGNIVQCS